MKSRRLRLSIVAASLALTPALAACGASSTGATSGSPSTSSTAGSSTPATSTASTTSTASATTLPTAVALGKKLEQGYKTQSTARIVVEDFQDDKGDIATIEIQGRFDDSLRSTKITSATSGNCELRKVGSKTYIHADRKFWIANKAGANTANLLADKWFVLPDNSSSWRSADLTLSEALASSIKPDADTDYSKMTVSRSTLGDQPVYALKDTDGSVLFMSTTDPALPLRVVPPEGEKGSMTMSDWGKPMSITAPTDAVTLPHSVGAA